MSADTPRRDDDDVTDADLEALFGRPLEVPSDASALDDLPPYAPAPHLDMSKDPDRYDPAADTARDAAPTTHLDMSQDPDRYDPSRDAGLGAPLVTGPLDMSQDPDRYDPRADAGAAGSGQTLSELLGGSAAQDEERDSFVWLAGLLAVAAFLGLVALFFSSVQPG